MHVDEDFAGTLRRFRARLTPAEVGLPEAVPRRVPGLRRAELAERAGVSEDYLRRLEQRRRSPSREVVDALASALRLTDDEHAKLRALAGFAPGRTSGTLPSVVTPAARRLIDRLTQVPACVCDCMWTVLDGNDRWRAYGCGAVRAEGRGRNMAWRTFTDAPTDVFRSSEGLTAFQVSLVADLRAAFDRYTDPRLHALIGDLRDISPIFEELWRKQPAIQLEGDRIWVVRPGHDDVVMDCDVLTLPEGDLRVIVFTTP